MRCEVIAVGTELLLGQIVDTNSSWIGEQLALAGINAHFQTKVGDNLARIVNALEIVREEVDDVRRTLGSRRSAHHHVQHAGNRENSNRSIQHDAIVAGTISRPEHGGGGAWIGESGSTPKAFQSTAGGWCFRLPPVTQYTPRVR